jgi:AGZA family xanthine/uracil permease-like MFS transporter
LQNIESAEAGGDDFDTFSSLAANGLGTISAAAFGSCFPTTIYIGHPGWKALGARAGYSTLNGVVITLICLTGTVSLINSVIPVEAGIPIVLWVGIIITAQAFQATPTAHAPAVAMGLFPALAAWGATIVQGAFLVAGNVTIQQALTTVSPPFLRGMGTEVNGFLLHGLIVVERGYIFTCMFLAAIAACLIERKFFSAAVWSLVSAAFTGIGLMHAYQVSGNNIDFLFNIDQLIGLPLPADGVLTYRAVPIAAGYLLFAAVFFTFGTFRRWFPSDEVVH